MFLKLVRILVIIGRPVYWLLTAMVGIFSKKNNSRVSWVFVFISLFFSVFGMGIWWIYTDVLSDLPDISKIYEPPSLSSKIRDRNGRLLYVFYQRENRTWVSISAIPRNLIEATIAIEDKDFFSHRGFSIKSIVRALWSNLGKDDGENLQGGSTITQQLVKNVFLDGEKSWRRKLREVVLSVLIEQKLSKEQILERYFNQVPYGGEVYGAQEASKRYFGKNVSDINLAEATFLAGLPAAPSSYSPYGESLEIAKKRQLRVLEEMYKMDLISQEELSTVNNTQITILNDKVGIEAPHFVFYVRDILRDQFGYNRLDSAGIDVTTSLDMPTQKMTDDIVADEVAKVKRLRIGNGAALVIDASNGDILAMTGSKDYYAKDIDGKYNITTALRQPGSSIKPINYVNALMHGATMSTVIEDSPVSYKIVGQQPYAPQNYNRKYMGKVTLKTALASSLNVPSVKLIDKYGVGSMIDMAERMGINTWKDRSRFGLSLALGAGEVKMVEIASAYTIFANMGNRIEVNPVLSINDYLGNKIYSKIIDPKMVIPPEYAFLINNALSDDGARAPIFGRGSKLVIPGKTVAVKTGTTNSLRDNWVLGWTPRYLVATWVGNNDNSPMSWVASGISGATPIWNRIMHNIIDGKSDETWSPPAGIVKAKVCGREDWFVAGSEKTIECPPPVTPTPTPNP